MGILGILLPFSLDINKLLVSPVACHYFFNLCRISSQKLGIKYASRVLAQLSEGFLLEANTDSRIVSLCYWLDAARLSHFTSFECRVTEVKNLEKKDDPECAVKNVAFFYA